MKDMVMAKLRTRTGRFFIIISALLLGGWLLSSLPWATANIMGIIYTLFEMTNIIV